MTRADYVAKRLLFAVVTVFVAITLNFVLFRALSGDAVSALRCRQCTAQFKAYATPTQSFQDYVALLRNNPRYAAALNTGSDVHAFAAGLQRGGYATDPEYANKIAAVANTVSSLKLSSTLPIPAKAGTL